MSIGPARRRELADLGPIAQLRAGRLGRRLPQLFIGLILYGFSLALMVRSVLGLAPWDVLHSGFIQHVPITLGQAVILFSFVVLLVWIPLKEKPGLGTIANAILVGISADATLVLLGPQEGWAVRVALLVVGVVGNGIATAMYIGAQFGRGPRDGLMTGLARRTGWPLRWTRMGIEGTVLALGWLLGGSVGLGTVVYAVAIGPLIQLMLPWFEIAPKREVIPAATT